MKFLFSITTCLFVSLTSQMAKADSCGDSVQQYLSKNKELRLLEQKEESSNSFVREQATRKSDDLATAIVVDWSAILNDCVDRIEGYSPNAACSSAQAEHRDYKAAQDEVEFVIFSNLSSLESLLQNERDPIKKTALERSVTDHQSDLTRSREVLRQLQGAVVKACVDQRL